LQPTETRRGRLCPPLDPPLNWSLIPPRNVSDTTAEEHDVNKHDGRPAPWTFTSQSSSNLYKTDKDLRAGK